ncbi:DnaB-like helicase C-terminal domain-containing protein [Nocardiopsis ganjiahuensis]|uniref:DnaB-like helicase C-terminal domain-containing protein n=1 Tax=Nocardiopsis ganjiahuensis TaxID=239984 RepID=UPI00034AABDD|nr:DnaB-like helicase C-terminal domain-containing protein [Nocardiopsis ganjiahuensis]
MSTPTFTGVDIPYAGLRELVPTLKAGTVTLLASWTSIGKTALAVDLARNAALAGVPTLYFSGHERQEALAVRMLAATAGVDNTVLEQRPVPDAEMERVHAAKDRLAAAPLTFGSEVSGPVSRVVEQAKDTDPRLLVVDDVDSLTDPDHLQEAELAKYGVMLSSLARTRQMSILVLSQLNRVPSQEYGRAPQIADLGVRRSLARACQTVLLMHRPDFYDPDDRPLEADIQVLTPAGASRGTVALGTLLARSQFVDLPKK